MENQRMSERQFVILVETLRDGFEMVAKELTKLRETVKDK